MEILFVLRLNKRNKYKPATIYCRIRINSKRANGDFSTFIRVDPAEWHSKAQKIISKRSGIDQDNETLENIRISLKDIYNEFTRKQNPISADIVKREYLKGSLPTITFLNAYKALIEQQKARKHAVNTIRSEESRFKNTERFLINLGLQFLQPDEFDEKLAYNFEIWLRTNLEKCGHNHAMKHLQLVKQVLKFCVRQKYIRVDPLQYFQISFEKPKLPVYLSTEELKVLELYRFASSPLQKVADLFLFQCYTGFAYIDLITFHPDQHIQKDTNMYWIYKERQKSGEMAILPFFDIARRILDKYNGKLPTISNQVYNRYIKEIAEILNIRKRLTSHIARKTAATLWLNAGVPEETVSRMLGQNSTKQLKIYARIQPKKIAEDTKVLNNK